MEKRMVVVPVSGDLQNSYETASILTRVESKEGTGEEQELRSHPFIFGLANIIFCAYMDQLIRNDTGTHYLTLYIGVEAVVSILFTMAYFMGSVKEVLIKTTSLPVSSPSRFIFVLMSSLRRPLFLGFYFTNCFFLALFFWNTRFLVGWSVVLFSLMILDIQLIIAILAILHNKISFAGLGVTILFISFILIAGSILFHQDLILGGLPLIQWVVNALSALKSGEESQAMIYANVMGGIMILSFLTGLKLMKA
ncbi:MAG: hypothetical protein ACHQQQ_07435 [Bacteroidota bacterium]